MRHKLIRFLALMILGELACLTLPQLVHAAGAGFTVSRMDNAAQYDPTVSYFDLKLKPAQQTQLQVRVTNLSAQPLKLLASPNTGYTLDVGNEAYDRAKLGHRSTAPYQLQELLGGPQHLTIPANSSQIVTFPLTMPQRRYNGILEGALYFLKLNKNTAQATDKSGFQISNRYSMALGVILRQNTTKYVAPKLKLTQIKVGTDSGTNFSPAVKANLANTRPALIRKMTIKSTVKRGDRILYRTNHKNINMAANSNFNYAITTNHKVLRAGNYQLHLVASMGSHRWQFTRYFKITAAQAQKTNQQANVKQNHIKWYIVLEVILFLVLLLLVYWLGKHSGEQKRR